jgi:hypothetical protein
VGYVRVLYHRYTQSFAYYSDICSKSSQIGSDALASPSSFIAVSSSGEAEASLPI